MWFDPWVGKIPRNGKWQPTPVFLKGAWQSIVHWVSKSQTRLSMHTCVYTHTQNIHTHTPTHKAPIFQTLPTKATGLILPCSSYPGFSHRNFFLLPQDVELCSSFLPSDFCIPPPRLPVSRSRVLGLIGAMNFLDNMVKLIDHFSEYFKGHWKSSDPPMPKYGTLVYWLFWAEGIWQTADSGRALCPPPFYIKAGHEISLGKVPSLYWKRTFLSSETGSQCQNGPVQTDLLKWSSISSLYLVPSHCPKIYYTQSKLLCLLISP